MDIKNTVGLIGDYIGAISELEADDVLKVVGLQKRRSAMDFVLPAIGLLGAGIAVGAAMGLLLAPKAGNELREDMGKRVSELKERFGQQNIGGNTVGQNIHS